MYPKVSHTCALVCFLMSNVNSLLLIYNILLTQFLEFLAFCYFKLYFIHILQHQHNMNESRRACLYVMFMSSTFGATLFLPVVTRNITDINETYFGNRVTYYKTGIYFYISLVIEPDK